MSIGSFPVSGLASLRIQTVADVLRTTPVVPAFTTCGQVFDLFAGDATIHAVVIMLEEGRFGLADRGIYLPTYLDRWNRDLFQRRPITQLMDRDPLVVPLDAPVDQVALLIATKRPEVLKATFIIESDGECAGIGTGLDLMRAVALRAEQASIAKSTFLAHMSHEIRTPLNAVIGNLELLTETALSAEQASLAQMAHLSAQVLLDVVGDLLDLSKIEADGFELEAIETDPRQLVEEALTVILPRARNKGLRIGSHAGSDVPASIRTDPYRLRQVLVNFLANAVKFTEGGGIHLNLRLIESDRADAALLRCEVTDSGPGFDPARADALFDPFVQEDLSTTRRYGGTGLGLAISKRIIGLLGGRIGCDAIPGMGAHFWFEIPVPAGSPARFAQGAPMLETVVLAAAAGRHRDQISDILISHGATLVGEHESGPIVVLIGDDELPVFSGAARRIIALCRSDDPQGRYRACRLGVSQVLHFPEQLADLPFVLAAQNTPVAGAERQHRQRKPLEVPAEFPPVLVIDDMATNRLVAERQLARLGLTSDSAENGLEGLEKARSNRYSAILVDGSMPVMDGVEFARLYREFERGNGAGHLPIIAVTAHALAGDARRFLAAGMDDYLPKPVSIDKLEAVLRTWLLPADALLDETPLDLAFMAGILGVDDKNEMHGLLKVFLDDLQQLLASAEDAFARRNRAAVAFAAHAAKSAASSASARHLAQLLDAIERNASTRDFDTLARDMEAVRREAARVAAQVAALAL